MKIQIMSDLHLEAHYDWGKSFFDSLDPSGVDILVLAGDIDRMSSIGDTLQRFALIYPEVVYVPGNHEFYGTSIVEGMKYLRDLIPKFPNVHFLESGVVVSIGGQRFIGDTMWFPFTVEAAANKRLITDSALIKDYLPSVFDRNAEFRRFLTNSLQDGDIVVTHHLPSPKAIAPHWEQSPLNCFFLSDMEEIIYHKNPAYWFFGHTHDPMDFTVGETRTVCNPLGYPGEHSGFDDRFIVEIS